MKVLTLRVIEEDPYQKKYSSKNKKLLKLGFSATVLLVCISVYFLEELK